MQTEASQPHLQVSASCPYPEPDHHSTFRLLYTYLLCTITHYLFIYIYLHLFTYLSIYLVIYIYLFIYLFTYLFL